MKTCSKCKAEKAASGFSIDRKNKDSLSNRCKECKREGNRRYYVQNEEKVRRKREGRREAKVKYDVEYKRKRRAEDPKWRLGDNISRLIRKGLKRGYRKGSRTEEILGISHSEFAGWMESKFSDGMSWDNMGEWHIDHIIPLCSAKTEEEYRKLNHYTNLQPLWGEENLQKGGSYIEEDKRRYLGETFW